MSKLEHARRQELAHFETLEGQTMGKGLDLDSNSFAVKTEDQSQWLIENMAASPLLPDEEAHLAELIKDCAWLATKSFMTASIAHKVGNMNNFHARWSGEKGKETGVPALLNRHGLPYRQKSILHPFKKDGRKFYFLVFTGQGEPPSKEEVRRLLTPSKEDDSDSEDGALIPA